MARPIPILFSIPNFITAGSGRAMLNIIERLDRSRFAPGVCVSRKGGDLDREVDSMRIPFIEAPFTVSPRPYVTLLWRAWRASRAIVAADLRRRTEDGRRRTEDSGQSSAASGPSSVLRPPSSPEPFTLWHSFHYADDYTEPLIARLAGARVWMYTKKNMGWGSRAWRLRSYVAKGIAVQNTAMIEQFFPRQKNKVRHIPPGVDVKLYRPGAPDMTLRQSWGFSRDTFLVGHVAQLVPIKNHPHLLRTFARVKGNVGLLLAGAELDESYSTQLRQLAATLGIAGRVRFCGRVDDVPSFLRTVDLFVFCSHKEACPVAVLEAMACGLASVVTGIPAMHDIHKEGETGLVVMPENIEAFAAAIDSLASEPARRQRLGKAARTHVENNFSLDEEARRYQEFYADLLDCRTAYERGPAELDRAGVRA